MAGAVTCFDALGFAIPELPEGLPPMDAVARLESLPESPEASIRLRAPRTGWR